MNYCFIGLPGAGKSFFGRNFAAHRGISFVDGDEVIFQQTGKTISQLLTALGNEKFLVLEEGALLSLEGVKDSAISPGGSVIYSEKVKSLLKKISTVIFLDASFELWKKNLRDPTTVVGLKEKGLLGVFSERRLLYLKYADVIVPLVKILSAKEGIKLIEEKLLAHEKK